MKNVSILLVLLMVGVLQARILHADQLTVNEAKKKNLVANRMMALARTSSLKEFNETVEVNGWEAPVIYSKWKVDVSTNWPREIADCRLAQREAGREIAAMLTRTVRLLLNEASSLEVEAVAKEQIRFIEWMSQTEGYGNLMLLERAQDILAIALIRLTGDMSYPLEGVDVLASKITEGWYAPEKLFRVYKMECPDQTVATDYKSAMREWRDFSEDVRKTSVNLAQFRSSEVPFGFEDRGSHLKVNQKFPEKIWDVKFHSKLFVGYDNPSLSKLRAMTTFRRTVGGFPAEFAEQRSFDATPISSSFRKAWDPYAFKKMHDKAWAAIGSTSAVTYYALITGILMPEAELEEWMAIRKERPGPAFSNMVRVVTVGGNK